MSSTYAELGQPGTAGVGALRRRYVVLGGDFGTARSAREAAPIRGDVGYTEAPSWEPAAPSTGVRPAELEARFRALAEDWRTETATQSSLARIVMHPAYQRIMTMGEAVLPYIMSDLRQRPGHWMWALRAIVGVDVADGESTLEGARQAWLRWAEENDKLG